MEIRWGVLLLLIVLCNLAGAIGGIWGAGDSDWYKDLDKPSFNPPNWIFAPVWTLLFSLMGVALYFIISSSNSELKHVALAMFIIQFILNILWSYFFFGIQNPMYSLIDILFLNIFILGTIFWFFRIDKTAGYLMIPYFIWVGFATVLNWFIWKMN